MHSPESTPRPEHPRPIFRREPWINLNGRWRFAFDRQDAGEQARWYRLRHPNAEATAVGGPANLGTSMLSSQGIADPFAGEILVPYPWESTLSGVGDTTYKGVAWYQRSLAIPADWGAGGTHTAAQAGAAGAASAAGSTQSGGAAGAGDGTSTATKDAAGEQPAGGLASAGDAAVSAAAAGARWQLRPVLCFGAVDWNAKVWVNGRFVGEHDGGYTPFEIDLSRLVRPGQTVTLTVRALDTSAADTPIGKQTDRWYTHSGGIWQTVWLEGRAAAHLTKIHVTPYLEEGRATFDLSIQAAGAQSGQDGQSGTYRVRVESADGAFPAVEETVSLSGTDTSELRLEVRVPDAHAWSPEDPHLYECSVSLVPAEGGSEADTVHTYFGLRSISTGRWDRKPYEYVLLNGEPIYLRGALDQAFHPDGIHTYPTDDAIRADVQAAKDLGLNYLRCHIKINEPRYYYWCDKLGVLMMYDFPSASIYTPKARANWELTFREAFERDYSHPSIFSWILFNETWGLEEHQTPASWQWVRERYDECKRLDPHRLVEDNSACLYDHVVSDINTWHFYIAQYGRAKRHIERVVAQTYEGSPFNYVSGLHGAGETAAAYRQAAKPLLNSEYAALGARQGDKDISYSFKFLTSELRRHDKICGYLYTELTDVEWEHNGFLEYDRTDKEFGYEAFVPGMTVADLNGADFVGLDAPPCRTVAPGSTFSAPVFVSHWDRRPIQEPVLRWRVTAIDQMGEKLEVGSGEWPVTLRRYSVVDAGVVEVTLPDAVCLATVAVELVDLGPSTGSGRTESAGTVRARNYVNVDVRPLAEAQGTGSTLDVLEPEVVHTGRGYAVRFAPEEYTDSSWPQPIIGRGHAKFGGPGAGWVEYTVPLPPEISDRPERLTGLRMRFEAGARNARSRLGWPDYRYVLPTDYPQTEARKRPSDLAVSVNGVVVGRSRLADDPADARGVLSFHLQDDFEFGSYGYLTTLEADATTAASIVREAKDGAVTVRFEVGAGGARGGLNLYGKRMGSTPVTPTLFLDIE
ncbi:MAG: GH2 [uncultured Chloroflexi bacterium]|uniref:GH2 n=1 Tax=uncultured Chloroflexota bacterium TaxID=166587 RepID=A0A6J4HZ55_9CHLR|nr:MAG: GH2 [uncultured Chloroflexota bacterium]